MMGTTSPLVASQWLAVLRVQWCLGPLMWPVSTASRVDSDIASNDLGGDLTHAAICVTASAAQYNWHILDALSDPRCQSHSHGLILLQYVPQRPASFREGERIKFVGLLDSRA